MRSCWGLPGGLGWRQVANLRARFSREQRVPWRGNSSDVLQLGLTDEPALPEGLKAGCMVPLVSRNRVLGLLGLGRREENAFSQPDMGFLAQVASQIAIAVENALEYGQITQAKERLTEQKLYLEDEIRIEQNFEEI